MTQKYKELKKMNRKKIEGFEGYLTADKDYCDYIYSSDNIEWNTKVNSKLYWDKTPLSTLIPEISKHPIFWSCISGLLTFRDFVSIKSSIPFEELKTLEKLGFKNISFKTDDLHNDIDLDVLYDPYYKPNNNIKDSSEIKLVQQALDKAKDLANTIEGALAGEEPYPDTYYRMCQKIIEILTKINKIV